MGSCSSKSGVRIVDKKSIEHEINIHTETIIYGEVRHGDLFLENRRTKKRKTRRTGRTKLETEKKCDHKSIENKSRTFRNLGTTNDIFSQKIRRVGVRGLYEDDVTNDRLLDPIVDTRSGQEVHVCEDSIECSGSDTKKDYAGSDVIKECTGSDVNNDRLLESFGDSNFEKDIQVLYEDMASKSNRSENCRKDTYSRGEYVYKVGFPWLLCLLYPIFALLFSHPFSKNCHGLILKKFTLLELHTYKILRILQYPETKMMNVSCKQ